MEVSRISWKENFGETPFCVLLPVFVQLQFLVPFLPFAVFFLLSYIARAPTFPVETRFHASQAFMLSILQFPASVLFPIMEKAGVPGIF